jgi:3-hydroxyacyl-[acyl-carrier-protein] dehydratase
MSTTYDKSDIENLIPHRYPINFLESVTVEDLKKGNGIATWPIDHIIFQGHFPNFPLVPGVYLIEAAAQVAAVIISSRVSDGEKQDDVGVLAGVNKFTINKPVRPDDKVEISVRLKQTFPKMGVAYTRGRVNGDLVFEAQLMLGVVSKIELKEKEGAFT